MPTLRPRTPTNRIMTMWNSGYYDTMDIAESVGMHEHEVCRIIYGLPGPKPAKARTKKPTPVKDAPAPQPKWKTLRYRLSHGVYFLKADGTGITENIAEAYEGTAEQCLETCATNPIAAKMVMELVL